MKRLIFLIVFLMIFLIPLYANAVVIERGTSSEAGSGDVTGPDGATTGNIPVFSDTTGKVVEDSGNAPGDFEPADATILKEANIGTSAGTVAAGDDARFTDARTPTAHASTHTNGTDDIQSATNAQKGLATAAHITAIEANTAKETNATHTGDVTGSGALTIATGAVGADELASTAVTPGSYTNSDITVDADGRITAASNGSASSSSKIIDRYITDPENLPTHPVRGTVIFPLHTNDSGGVETISQIRVTSDTDDYTLTLWESNGLYDFSTASDSQIDVCAASTNGTTEYYFGTSSGFDDSSIADGNCVFGEHTSGAAGIIHIEVWK